MKLKPKCSNTKVILHLYKLKNRVDINGVSNENSVYESRKLPYSKAKTRGKVLNKLQRNAEVLLVITIKDKSNLYLFQLIWPQLMKYNILMATL